MKLSENKPLKLLSFNPYDYINRKYKGAVDPVNPNVLHPAKVVSAFYDLGSSGEEVKTEFKEKGIRDFMRGCRTIRGQLRHHEFSKFKIYEHVDGLILGDALLFDPKVYKFLTTLGKTLYAGVGGENRNAEPYFTLAHTRKNKHRLFPLGKLRQYNNFRKSLNTVFVGQNELRILAEERKWAVLAKLLHARGIGLLVNPKRFSNVEMLDIFRANNVPLYKELNKGGVLRAVTKVWPY